MMSDEQILKAIATALANVEQGTASTQDRAILACIQQVKLILSSKEI